MWDLNGIEKSRWAHNPKRIVDVQQKCKKENIAFFFKQWGKKTFNPNQLDQVNSKIFIVLFFKKRKNKSICIYTPSFKY